MILHLFAIIKGHYVFSAMFGIFLVLLAAGAEASNRTLIYISLMGNGTLLLVAILNNRKLNTVARQTDGIFSKLEIAKEEVSVAKQELARGEGKEQERIEERSRKAEQPSKVEIVQPPGKYVPVKPDKD